MHLFEEEVKPVNEAMKDELWNEALLDDMRART